jgi:hypothetical protein
MARRWLAALVVTVIACTLPCVAKTHSIPAPLELDRVVDYAHSLEEHPLAKDNLAKRIWLTEWIVNIPAVDVDPCCKVLTSLDEVNNTYSQQLRMQAVYSQVAFQLEHPDVRDREAIQTAGLAGTLKAYRAIQRFDPSAKYPVLDDLLSLEKKGKLQEYVGHQTHCIFE